jgi:predicted dehydrogenase
MKKLRAAVAGVGYLGTFHAQKYKNLANAELVGVFDVNKEQANKVATSLNVGVFNTIQEMPGKVDLVTIAASTQSHYEVAKFLIEHGIHVNIEKPITAKAEQALILLQLAKEKNITLTVGHIERFNPAFVKWRSVMGTPKFLEFERMGPFKARGADVSVVHDLMIHDIDLLLSLKPGPMKSISATGMSHLSNTVDWSEVWIDFESGLKVRMKASRVSPVPIRLIRAFEADTHWTVYLNNGELEKVQFDRKSADVPLVVERLSTDKVDALQRETEVFVDAVANNKQPLISGEDGLAALELVERICAELKHV